ncbi:MAG TPA: hypothetical protein VFU49_18545 [Ktedonobacteraceae bacterium]|nr:hypothetical protein [Ktedonobacteraceae bacterium]
MVGQGRFIAARLSEASAQQRWRSGIQPAICQRARNQHLPQGKHEAPASAHASPLAPTPPAQHDRSRSDFFVGIRHREGTGRGKGRGMGIGRGPRACPAGLARLCVLMLISELLAANVDGEQPSEQDILSFCILLLVDGTNHWFRHAGDQTFPHYIYG